LNDVHHYCHTLEGIGHSLQAGKRRTSSFINIAVKGRNRKMPVHSTKASTDGCQPSGTAEERFHAHDSKQAHCNCHMHSGEEWCGFRLLCSLKLQLTVSRRSRAPQRGQVYLIFCPLGIVNSDLLLILLPCFEHNCFVTSDDFCAYFCCHSLATTMLTKFPGPCSSASCRASAKPHRHGSSDAIIFFFFFMHVRLEKPASCNAA
jgi:hypothetical protein